MKMKTNTFAPMRRFAALLLAALLVTGAGSAFAQAMPVQITREGDKLTIMDTGDGTITAQTEDGTPVMLTAIRTAPLPMEPQETLALPYIGLTLPLPEALRDAMAEGSIELYGEAEQTEDGTLAWATLEFLYVPQAERPNSPGSGEGTLYEYDAFVAWTDTLPHLARISIYPESTLEGVDLETLTGYAENELIGVHGGYGFVYSTGWQGSENVDESEEAAALMDQARAGIVVQEPVAPDDAFAWFVSPVHALPEGGFGAFDTEDMQGNPVSEAVFGDARLTMVNVWTTWCGPCISELPHLGELSRELAGSGVQILGILQDAVAADGTGALAPDAERVEMGRTICERTGADYPMLLPDAALMDGLLSGVLGYPTTYFVDAEGAFVGREVVGSRSKEEWQSIIEERLAMVGAN